MKRMLSIICIAALAGIIVGCATTPSSSDVYQLTVEMNTPYNKQFTIATDITPNEPFELTKRNGDIRNTISGVLRPPVDGKFPLDVTVSEWASEKSNIKGTTELKLDLDTPWSGGLIASSVYARTVTLSKSQQHEMQNQ